MSEYNGKTLTILTPVYNRRDRMQVLFESLQRQTNKAFHWMIVDDGSTDNIEEDITYYKANSDFEVLFYRKENGGKHTALNYAFDRLDSELTFIVDSDDYLTNDAVEVILEKWDKIKCQDNICNIIFLRGFDFQNVVGDSFPQSDIIKNDIDMRCRTGIKGDKAEVFRTDLLKKYRFPEFEGEKFQGENYIWWQLSYDHDSYYVNKIIYICEYLEGGLTKSGRKLRIMNPRGGMENSRMGFFKRFPTKMRIKRAMLYVCYGKFAKVSFEETIRESGYPMLIIVSYLPGVLLYWYWKLTVK